MTDLQPASEQGVSSAPRLLFVVPEGSAFVSHRLNLAIAAQAQGYRVAVACPPGPAVPAILATGAEHYPLKAVRRSINPFRELVTLLTIANAIRSFRPDMMHLVTSKAVIYGGVLARIHGIPALSAISGLGRVFLDSKRSTRALRRLVSLGYRAALSGTNSIVLFQNADDETLFRDAKILAHDRTAMIPGSGVDLDRIRPRPLPEGPPVLGLPARLIRDKGVGEFVEAARILKGRGVAARFRLIGDPDMFNLTTVTPEEIEAWVSAGLVEWQPFTSDIDAALAACHIVVLPSYREGFPKALIDAAAAGRAAAASNVPGCRQAIVEGMTGVLFRPRDPIHMADVLEPLIRDPERIAAMGRAARVHAERTFDLREVTASHLKLYERMRRPALQALS